MTNIDGDIYIRDYILPLAVIAPSGEPHGEGKIVDAYGTCCLLGGRGFGLTAAHVLDQMDLKAAYGLFVVKGQWHATPIVRWARHPQQDIAIVEFEKSALTTKRSFLGLSGVRQHASCHVDGWGYPKHVTLEIEKEPGGQSLFRPELIYFSGYVRRRIPRELPFSIYRGNSFFELSFVAGEACSGAPVVVRRGRVWDVAGVYVGESTSSGPFAVGYAATADSFADWKPEIVGKSLREEAAITT